MQDTNSNKLSRWPIADRCNELDKPMLDLREYPQQRKIDQTCAWRFSIDVFFAEVCV